MRTGSGSSPTIVAAINSLIGYRAFRYGRHLDLIITDQHSYRSADPFDDKAVGAFGPEFTGMFPEDAAQILDGGRAFNGGNPPAEISFNDAHVANPRKDAPPQTILGATQKAWFKDQLRKSTATWKIWGNSEGAPDWRSDPQNLPPGLTKETWPKTTYAVDEHRRLWNGVSGARRDLRSGTRREDYGLRDRLRRPTQLLGGLRDVGVAAGQVRSRRPELRRRVAFERRHHGSDTSIVFRKPIRFVRYSSPIAPAEANPIGPTTCC